MKPALECHASPRCSLGRADPITDLRGLRDAIGLTLHVERARVRLEPDLRRHSLAVRDTRVRARADSRHNRPQGTRLAERLERPLGFQGMTSR
eukprot:3041336-Rhodomonas_salina.1